MNSQRISIVLGVTAGVLAMGCVYLWRELGQERARNGELLTHLESTPVPAPISAPQLTREQAAVTSPAPEAAKEAAAQSTTTPHFTGTQEDWDAYQRRMMRNPKYREAQREQNRLSLAPRRANLIRLLGMTPAQADAVIDLQIDLEFQRAEESGAAATEAQEKAYQAKVREMVGGDKQAQLDHYMETRGTRMQVDTFRTQLNGADTLREDQVEPLVEALSADRSHKQEELEQYRETLNWDGEAADSSQRYGERQIELMKEMHADMHFSAAPILSASQLEQLDAMLRRDLQRREAQMRMSRIQSKVGNATGLTTQPN